MLRLGPLVVLSAALGVAPFQCGSESDPAMAIEESPAEALYALANKFKTNGDEGAWRETLQHIIARYPASRFAQTAREELADNPAPRSTPSSAASHTAASPTTR